MLPLRINIKHFLLTTFWLSLVLAGYGYMTWYSLSPGPIGRSTGYWPLERTIKLTGEHPTLVMVLHPFCPCSKASVAELQKLVAILKSKLKVILIVIDIPGLGHSGELEKLARTHHFSLIYDDQARLSHQLGVLTSGHTLLYDSRGKLLYSGGITSARGHEGDNNGEDTIISLTLSSQQRKQLAVAPVFGCELFNKGQE